MSDYLLKPIPREALLEVLATLEGPIESVLVVDDEQEELRMFWRMLSTAPQRYQVYTATNGARALRIMKERKPDAVLLDLVMPGMDGFQFLEARSRDEELKKVPVVVITALDPSGQPIVGGKLALANGSGLSVAQFLSCIQGLAGLFRASLPID